MGTSFQIWTLWPLKRSPNLSIKVELSPRESLSRSFHRNAIGHRRRLVTAEASPITSPITFRKDHDSIFIRENSEHQLAPTWGYFDSFELLDHNSPENFSSLYWLNDCISRQNMIHSYELEIVPQTFFEFCQKCKSVDKHVILNRLVVINGDSLFLSVSNDNFQQQRQ